MSSENQTTRTALNAGASENITTGKRLGQDEHYYYNYSDPNTEIHYSSYDSTDYLTEYSRERPKPEHHT